jgi:riboflavin kinase/FMN adenylyltransferase
MNITCDLSILPSELAAQGAAVAVGNFDGVHIGHRRLLNELLGVARKRSLMPVVLTFFPHPRHFFDDPANTPQITSQTKKMTLLAEAGVACVVVLPFNQELAGMEADAFVREILVKRLHAKVVVIGENAFFGKNKCGNYALLRALGRSPTGGGGAGTGFTALTVPRLRVEHKTVSSGFIRDLILAGRMAETANLLGRYHSVDGFVVHGQQRGRTLGFPTANICPDADLVPQDGVYAAWVKLGGLYYPAVVSVGINSTFGETDVCIEAHILGFSKDIYKEHLSLLFVERLRDMLKFPDTAALIAQIKIDIDRAKAILADTALRNAAPEPRRG